jgi:hypothetical protein
MSKRVKIVLAVGCGVIAVLWAAVNLHRAFAPDVVTDRAIAFPSRWWEVPDFVLLVILVVLLRANVSVAPLAARHGKATEWCRIAHFWTTIGCIGIAIGYDATFRFGQPLDAALYAPPPGLAVLEACLLPIQVVFAACALAVRLPADRVLMGASVRTAHRRVWTTLLRRAAWVIGSPGVAACVVTFLVVALLTDVWWACRVPAKLGLQGWRHVAAGIAVTLAFIAGLGSRNALATLASMVIGVVAAPSLAVCPVGRSHMGLVGTLRDPRRFRRWRCSRHRRSTCVPEEVGQRGSQVAPIQESASRRPEVQGFIASVATPRNHNSPFGTS